MANKITHWHVGGNTPGYSPESDVALAVTVTEARDMVVEEIERHLNWLAFGCDHAKAAAGCAECDAYLATERIQREAERADVRQGYSVIVPTGRSLDYVIWAQACTDTRPDCSLSAEELSDRFEEQNDI